MMVLMLVQFMLCHVYIYTDIMVTSSGETDHENVLETEDNLNIGILGQKFDGDMCQMSFPSISSS